MAEIQTFQDGTSMGTFSQIKLDDGNKILISLTQTEIAIFKIGFFGTPKGTLWKEDLDRFLSILYSADSSLTDKSALKLAVQAAITCKNIDEVREKFEGLKRLKKINQQMSALHQKKEELLDEREHLADKTENLVNKIGSFTDDMSEKVFELKSWQAKLKVVTELLIDSFDARYKVTTKLLRDFLDRGQDQINGGQKKEIILLSMMETAWSVYAVFTEAEAKDVIESFKVAIFDKYLPNAKEREGFEKLFWKRWDEYAEILDPKNENLILQIGGIFCDHFFGTRISKVEVMGLVGMSFVSSSKEIKKSLEK